MVEVVFVVFANNISDLAQLAPDPLENVAIPITFLFILIGKFITFDIIVSATMLVVVESLYHCKTKPLLITNTYIVKISCH